ncbi:hypothetical protein GH865_12975 [Rhodocyclus tenuis]|uniref:hypothetical protein n=1 Tax=Rhodocyclus gracilis TaxID=2929842 RepID=UPI001298D5C1|nr:hypothetical protein [Rhodocyclus gracilis]MRD74151.1 hypothetical protein [Rhodocyclus gracilis]
MKISSVVICVGVLVALAGCASTMQSMFNLPADLSESEAKMITDQVMSGTGKVRLDERTLAAFGGIPPGQAVPRLAKLKLDGRLIEQTRRTGVCRRIGDEANRAGIDPLSSLNASRHTLFDATADGLIERAVGVVSDSGCVKVVRMYSALLGANRDIRESQSNLRGYNGDSSRYFAKALVGYQMYRDLALADSKRVAELVAAPTHEAMSAAWRKIDHLETCELLRSSAHSQQAGLLLKSSQFKQTVWSAPHYDMFCELSGVNDMFRAAGADLP